jgi:hypothetical protein
MDSYKRNHYLENNPTKYLLSPRWERIEVRGDRIWIFTPTLPLPPRRGRGEMKSIFIL